MQWHDLNTILDWLLRQQYAMQYAMQHEVTYAPQVASYAYYASCVASGALSSGEHLQMVSFRHGLDTPSRVTYAFCDQRVRAMHFQDDCHYGGPWRAILYTKLAGELHHIVPEWGVPLPTYRGFLIQWGGAHLSRTVGAVPSCPVPSVSLVTMLLCGRVLPASQQAMIRHGATLKQVCAVLVTFWKAVLHMSCTPHPPQLHDKGNWLLLEWELTVYQALFPSRHFPEARG